MKTFWIVVACVWTFAAVVWASSGDLSASRECIAIGILCGLVGRDA